MQSLCNLSFEDKIMAVNAFDVLNLLEKSGILTKTPIDGRPFKVRVRYGHDVDYTTRKRIMKILHDIGFQQVGNTSSWVIEQKANFNAVAD
jgi:hypothetical protein